MSDIWDLIERRGMQIGALILAPIILIVGMAIVTAVHDVLESILVSITGDFFGLDMLISILSLALFIILVFVVYKWVQAGGPGVFYEWRR